MMLAHAIIGGAIILTQAQSLQTPNAAPAPAAAQPPAVRELYRFHPHGQAKERDAAIPIPKPKAAASE